MTDHGRVQLRAVPAAYRNQAGYEPGRPARAHGCRGGRHRRAGARDVPTSPRSRRGGDPRLAGRRTPSTTTCRSRRSPRASRTTRRTGSRSSRTLTGVDLATVDGSAGGLRGRSPARRRLVRRRPTTTQTTNAAFASGTVEHETAPLTAQIATLTTAVTDASGREARCRALLDAARAEIAQLTAAATPREGDAARARGCKARTLARQGATVTVTGAAGARSPVELAISETRARKLGLKSSVLGDRARRRSAPTARRRSRSRPGKAARKALRKLKRPIALTVTARSGDRFATSGGTLTR